MFSCFQFYRTKCATQINGILDYLMIARVTTQYGMVANELRDLKQVASQRASSVLVNTFLKNKRISF